MSAIPALNIVQMQLIYDHNDSTYKPPLYQFTSLATNLLRSIVLLTRTRLMSIFFFAKEIFNAS